MSWHKDKNEDGRTVEFHNNGTRLPFNSGPPSRSRKKRSQIKQPGMHRTHKRKLIVRDRMRPW